MAKWLSRYSNTPKDRKLSKAFQSLIGFRPKNIQLYKLALTHASSSKNDFKEIRVSNERLEFLGDAILSAVVADYLFKKYPFKDEGFLTEVRSRLVSRESLNQIGRKLQLMELIKMEDGVNRKQIYASIYGNTLEAVIGAIYLDKNFKTTYRFIVDKLLIPNFNLDVIIQSTNNYKSMLIEWGQAQNVEVSFEIVEIVENKKFKEFTARVKLNDEAAQDGYGSNKKKAEQNAAFKTLESLNLLSNESN